MLKILFLAFFFLFSPIIAQTIDLSKVQWEYRWGDSFPNENNLGWETIDFPSNPPERNSQTNVWYRVLLPQTLPLNPHLYIFSIDLIAEVYFEDLKIYSYGTFDAEGKGKFEGWPWHMIKLPSNSEGKYLYFRVYSDYPDIGLWGEVTIDSKGELLQRMLDEDLLKISVGAIAFFIGLVFILLYLKKLNNTESFLLGFLFASQGVDLLLSTKVIQLYFNFPLLKQYLLAFCYFIVPVGMAAILEHFIGSGYLKVIRRIWQFHLIYVVVALGGAILGLYNVSSTYVYYDYVHYFITYPILTLYTLYFLYKGNNEQKIIAFGFLFLSLSWIHSSLIAWGIISWQEHPAYIAILICLALCSYVIVRNLLITQEIQKQKEEFESIFKYSKDGIAITDLGSNFLEVNDAYLDLVGYTKEELLKTSCLELSAIEDKKRSENILKQILEEGYVENFEKTCITKSGERVVVSMTVSLLPDKKRLLVVAKDLTAVKNIENQSRLIAMGEMIGNIAHQWRQPLSVISTSASGMKLKLEYDMFDQKQFIELTELIVKQSNYLSQTIDNFRDFIKGDETFTDISIISSLEKAIDLVGDSLKDNYITLVKQFESDILIKGNENELAQAFINILNNAQYVLKEKVSNESDRLIVIKSLLVEENRLELLFLDSGGGIDSLVIDRIFEPYFTTKHKSMGTGLGLSMAHKIIVKKHKNDLQVYNEEFSHNGKLYKGACFKITFSDTPFIG